MFQNAKVYQWETGRHQKVPFIPLSYVQNSAYYTQIKLENVHLFYAISFFLIF